jgi:hypothetical protein
MASRRYFLDFTIIGAWKLLDAIRHIWETWSYDLEDEGGIKIKHDFIKAFVEINQVDELGEKYERARCCLEGEG